MREPGIEVENQPFFSNLCSNFLFFQLFHFLTRKPLTVFLMSLDTSQVPQAWHCLSVNPVRPVGPSPVRLVTLNTLAP